MSNDKHAHVGLQFQSGKDLLPHTLHGVSPTKLHGTCQPSNQQLSHSYYHLCYSFMMSLQYDSQADAVTNFSYREERFVVLLL